MKKCLLLAFPLLALASFSFSGQCRAQSQPLLNSTAATTRADCTVANVTNGRNYIRKINTITRVALESFGRNTTIFLPLTTPLIVGLTQNPLFTPTGPNMTTLSSIITANGQAMNQLAGTLEGIVDQWATSEAAYQTTYSHPNTSERRQFIVSINNITRSSLQQLGRNNSRLERITNPLSATLLFSPITSLGYTLFNVNQNISKTGGNLKGLAHTLQEMARNWALTTAQYADQPGAAACQPSSQGVESVTRAVPALINHQNQSEQQQFDQQCLASRPTTRSFITSLNEKTQHTLSAFGRDYPRLQPLSTPLWLGLRFSTITQKGYTAYNYNQNISLTAAELKAFAQSILDVTSQWEEAEAQFVLDSNRDCRVQSATTATTATTAAAATTTTEPLINPRVNTEAVTAAPVEVTSSSERDAETSAAPEETSTTVSQVSTAAASIAPATSSVIVEASTSTIVPVTASAAPEGEEKEASTTVSQVSTAAASIAPATSSVIVKASTSTVVPVTASAAPEEGEKEASTIVSQVSTAAATTAPVTTSVIVESTTASSTVVSDTASASEESSVAPGSTELATQSTDDTTVNPGKDLLPLQENFIN